MKRFLKREHIGKEDFSVTKKYIDEDYSTHFHEFYEIEYVCSGSGSCTLNGQPFAFENGMLFFMTPLDYHSVSSSGAEIFNVMFSEQFVDFSYIEPFLRHSTPKSVVIDGKERLFFESILSEMTQNRKDTRYQSALLGCLLIKLSGMFSVGDQSTLNKPVSKMLFYALNHFQEKATLDAAADFAGLTPAYASLLFKKEMQISFKEYLDSLRFDHAEKLLVCSKLSVAEICAKSGFEDVPNFFRRFRVRYGMTPIQFRKKMNGS